MQNFHREYVKIHEEIENDGIKNFEWDLEDKEFKSLKLQLLESGYTNPDSGKPQYGIEMFEAYSFMKTVGIQECKDSEQGLWGIELMTWYDNDHNRQKWDDEYHNLLLNEKNLLFGLRDLAEADTQIILEISMQQAQKQTLEKIDEMLEKIDKYMNVFQFKWLKAEAEKNSELLRASQLGNNEFKPIQSCAHLKRQYPFKKTGFYWIQDLCMKDPLRVYCNFEQPRITSYHYIGYTEYGQDYKQDILNLKDIRLLCANKGLSMIELQGEKDIRDVQAYLEKLGLTFKENNMVPLGFDYGCDSAKGCSQRFISLNSIYSYDVAPFFLHLLDMDNIWMQPFKDKSKRDAVGFGVGSKKMVSFQIGDVNLPVKGVVCGQNYDIEKSEGSFIKIECDTIARFNPDFDGVQYTNIRVSCPRDCVGKTENMQQIWGNSIFKDDSYICLAGIHNGVITNQDGGKFIVGMMTGRNYYKGYESNQVKSLEWNTDWDRSFVVNHFNPVCPIDFVLSQKEKIALKNSAFLEQNESIKLKKVESATPINVGQNMLPQFMQTQGNGLAEWNANWFASDDSAKSAVIKALKDKYPDLNSVPQDTEPSFDLTKKLSTGNPDKICKDMQQGNCAFVFDGTTVTSCSATSVTAIACAEPPLPPVNQPNEDLRSTAKAMEYIKFQTELMEKDMKRQIQVAQDSRLMLADVQGKLSVSTNTDISFTSLEKQLNTWDAHARTTFNVGMDMLSQSKIKTKSMEDEEFMLAAKEQTYYIYKVFEINYLRILAFNWETHVNLKSENISKEEIPWIFQKDGLKGHSDAIHQTTEIKITHDILATSLLLKNKLYYDAQFKSSIRMMNSGLVGIIFRAVDHENFYSFEIKGGDDGFKRIRRYKNGKGKTLFKVDDGGFLEDTWYTVLIQMTGYHITVRMDLEKDPYAKIETLQELQMVASVSHGQFPGGTIGFGVNGCKDFFVDNVVVQPQECTDTRHLPPIKQKDVDGNKQADEEPPSGFIFMPANCNRWVETFSTDIDTIWRFIDPETAREGPSVWRYSQRFDDYIYVLAQETKIYDPTLDMTPAIAELSVPKICGEGVLATTLMGMEMKDDAYVGIGFKYIKKTDFFSFEVYANKCQVRQILDGEWKEPIAVNDQCNITSEKFHQFHISMNSTGHTIIYKDLVKVLDFEVNPEYHYGGMAMLSFKTHSFFVDQKMMPHLDFKDLPEEIVEEDSEEEPEPIVESESEDEPIGPAPTSDLESELNRIKVCSNKTTALERQDYCNSEFVGDQHSIDACQLENNFCGVCCDRNTQEGHDQIHGICTKECTVQFHTVTQPIQDLEWSFCVNSHSTTSNSAYFNFCENHSRDDQSQLNCKNDMCNLCCMSISNILNLKINDETDLKCRSVCYEQFGSKIIPEA